jgi:ABC-2 type transport system ATP-binding protein
LTISSNCAHRLNDIVYLNGTMITFTSATKKYGSGTLAVDDVSFTVGEGEFFALLGPNGAGKTTLVKMLLDFVKPTRGGVAINGISSGTPRSRQGVGYLAENLKIPSYLSGQAYLKRQAELCGMANNEAKKRIAELLDTVGMSGKETAKVKTYSKGMLQRIGLAGAMLCGPKVLVLDEPVSGLDPLGIRDVRRIMEGLKHKGVTIILNSHLLSEVEKTCDTAAIINKGRIVLKDKISSIVREGETLEDVFVRAIEGPHA